MALNQQKEVKRIRLYVVRILVGVIFTCLSSSFYSSKVSAQETNFGNYQETWRLGRGTAETVAWRPDGSSIAVGGSLGIWLYTDDFQDIAHWNGETDVRRVAWSPDGSQLASVELNGSSKVTIHIWDTATHTSILTLSEQPSESFGIAWSPDGTKVAFTVIGGVRIWDMNIGQLLTSFGGHQAKINSVAWSLGGDKLATASDDNTVKVWDTETYQLLTTLQGHISGVYEIAWHPLENWLATSSYDGTVGIWDVTTGQRLVNLEGGAYALVWSQDGTQLANSNGRDINLWTISQNENSELNSSLSTLGAHNDAVISLSWKADGDQLASVDGVSTIRLWDINTRQVAQFLQVHQGASALSVAFKPNGNYVANSNGNNIYIWDVSTGQLLNTFQDTTSIRSITWSPNGSKIASGDVDGLVNIWELASGQVLATFQANPNAVNIVAWSQDGSKIATGGEDSIIRIWDASSYQLVTNLNGHTDNITSLAWGSDNIHLASGSVDQTARVWDTSTGESTVFSGHTLPVLSVAWKPDGSQLATGGADRTVSLWDVADGNALTTMPQQDPVSALAWYPTDNFLTVGQGTTVNVIDMSNGSTVRVYDLQERGVRALSWSTDGSKLAIADTMGAITIWGIPDFQL